MIEVIFLILLAVIWMTFASVQDLRYREVANWLNFSLIIFALGFRFFYGLFNEDFSFFYQGLIGLGIFFVLGNLFYYSRLFAGGDAKLMIALGTVLGFTNNFFQNLKIYGLFILIFLFVGGIYGGVWSLVLSTRNFENFKKTYKKLFSENLFLINLISFLGLIILIFGFFNFVFFLFGVFVFLLPYLYIYAKAVDEACMIEAVFPKQLTEGDWLYKSVKINKTFIDARWEGLNKKEIKLLQKFRGKILIRRGIAFVPVFLISFLILVLLFKLNF